MAKKEYELYEDNSIESIYPDFDKEIKDLERARAFINKITPVSDEDKKRKEWFEKLLKEKKI